MSKPRNPTLKGLMNAFIPFGRKRPAVPHRQALLIMI
jgi:hypothetical protein